MRFAGRVLIYLSRAPIPLFTLSDIIEAKNGSEERKQEEEEKKGNQ